MRLFLWSLLIIVGLSACKQSKEDAIEEIKSAQLELGSKNIDYRLAEDSIQNIVNLYVDFANNFPDDSLAPEYLFKAAEIQRNFQKYDKALYLLDQAYQKYAEHYRAPYCLFVMGLIYQDDLKDLEKAKEKYDWFLQKFPDHEFADDTQFLLDNLDKSDEEILRMLEKKAAALDSSSI